MTPDTTPADTRSLRFRLPMALVLLGYLFTLLPGGLSWDYDAPANALEGSWVVKLQWTPMYLLAFVVLYRAGLRSWVHHLRLNPLLWVVLAYAACSLLWSPLPVTTAKRLTQLTGVCLMGLAMVCVARPSAVQWIRMTLLAMIGLLLASIVVVVLNPTLGKESFEGLSGAWRGVLSQKNGLGMVASLAFMFGVFHLMQTPTRPLHLLLALAPILLCLVMAKSSTSILVAAVGSATYLMLRRDHIASPLWRMRILMVLLSLALIGFLLFFAAESRPPSWGEVMSPVAGLFGKNADLTGRTDIWQYMWPVIDTHWLRGIGYGAFWLGPGSPSQVILDEFDWEPNQSHDGYIDVTNELGVIGLTLELLAIAWQVRNLFCLSWLDAERAAMHGTLLLVILFSNVTETSLLHPLHIFNLMLYVSFFQVNQRLWELQQRHPGATPR